MFNVGLGSVSITQSILGTQKGRAGVAGGCSGATGLFAVATEAERQPPG